MVNRRLGWIALGVALAAAPLLAQMPDLRQMAGQPLPSGDLPAGTVSVRVVRQTIANNVSGADVEIVAAGGAASPRKMVTDAGGRAVFADLPAGASLQAVATVDGERLVSQPFTVPATGGLRILLAAGLGTSPAAPGTAGAPAPTTPAAAAAPGSITLGSQSRIVVELAEGSVEVFCIVDLVNTAGRAVTLPSPVVFELPAGALNASTLEGSSTLARVEGSRVVVAGPLPAGATNVQFAYRLPTDGPAIRVRQALPLAAPQLTAIVRKHGDLTVTMAGERGRRDVPMAGRTYIVLNGAVDPGGAVELNVEGVPSHARWPRLTALVLAGLVVLVGVWAVTTGRGPQAQEATRLRDDRAARFNELLALERKLTRQAAPAAALTERRARLIDEIAELDLALETLHPEVASPAGGSGGTVGAGARASAVQ